MLAVVMTLIAISGYASNAKAANLKNEALFARLKLNSRLLTNFVHSNAPAGIVDKQARRAYIKQLLKARHLMVALKGNSSIFTQFLQKKSSSANILGPSYHSWNLASDADTILFNHTLYTLSPGNYYMAAFMSTPLPSPYQGNVNFVGVTYVAFGYDSADDLEGNYSIDGNTGHPSSPLLSIPDGSTAYLYTSYIDWSKYSEVGFEWYVQFTDGVSYEDYFWDLEDPFTGHP